MYTRIILALIVSVIGGASLFLAAFYPKKTVGRIQADKSIKNSRRLIRFLRLKLFFNGTALVLLGLLLWLRGIPDYAVGIVAFILVGVSYFSERRLKRG